MGTVLNPAPSGTDSFSLSLHKINQLLFTGSGGVAAPPGNYQLTNLAPNGSDSIALSLRKINSILYATGGSTGGGGGGGITTETDPLSVHTTGGTMTGQLILSDPTGNIVGMLQVFDPTYTRGVQINPAGSITLFSSIATLSLSQASGNNSNLGLGPSGGLTLGDGNVVTVELDLNQSTGDVSLKCIAGPNSGKSVNLTQAFAGNVSKAGDTMTGALTVPATGGGYLNPGVTVNNPYGDNVAIAGHKVAVNGTSTYGATMGTYGASGQCQMSTNNSGVPTINMIVGSNGYHNQFSINASGDLIISQTAGPNAGKSVNLTVGKWA